MNINLVTMDERTSKEILESFQKRIYNKIISSSFDFRKGIAEITIQGTEIGLISLYNITEDCYDINIIFYPTNIKTIGKTLCIRAKIDVYNESDFIP